METKSLKALALKVLKRNSKGNFQETVSFHAEKLEDNKFPGEETSDPYKERSAIMEHKWSLSMDQADKYAWCREVCTLTKGQAELCESV
jgi:hypothetical protein